MAGLLSSGRKGVRGLLSSMPQQQLDPRLELAMPPMGNMPAAPGMAGLNLTPQELYLYGHHAGNVQGGSAVKNADGSTSTLYAMSVEGPSGRTYMLPTVWDGKILPPREAIKRAAAIGWDRWPSYGSPDEADARYSAMHDVLAQDVR